MSLLLLSWCHMDSAFISVHPVHKSIPSYRSDDLSKLYAEKPNPLRKLASGVANLFKSKDSKKNTESERPSVFRSKEKEPKSEIDRFIDQEFAGAGPMMKLVGAGLKGIAKVVEGGLQEQQRDVAEVKDSVERLLRFDSTAIGALGDEIRVGQPFSQASYSSSVNGVTLKNVQLGMPVQGSHGQAIVSVQAQQKDSKLELTKIVLQVNGRQLDISTSGGPFSGPAESAGPSPSGPKGKTVVDVEIL